MYKSIVSFAALGWLSLVRAQVPSDLSSAFDPSSIILQVSYTGQSDNGFKDGSQFTADQTSKTPTFALGDSSGVNTALNLMVMMVDTTDDNQRVLHFLQGGFKATEDKTAIASSSQAIQAYQAPGAMGDTGLRKYSFLLFSQPSKGFSASNMPSPGSAFNVEDFMSKNSLQPALAGVSMQVQVNGGSTGSHTTQEPAPVASEMSTMAPPPPPPAPSTTSLAQAPPAPMASMSMSAVPPVITDSTSVSFPVTFVSSLAPPPSMAASSAMASGSAAVMSLTSSAAAAGSTASSNATFAAGTGTGTANTGPSATSSTPATQTSSNAIALSANVLAALPWLIVTGVILG